MFSSFSSKFSFGKSAIAGPPPVVPFVPVLTTVAANPGDGSFTALYSGPTGVDEGHVELDIGWSFIYNGVSYSRLGISSNSYILFGTGSTTFTYPSYIFSAASPAFPGIGVCCDDVGNNDTNYQYVGYRNVDASTFQVRWKGGYPYNQTSVNRIWDMTFYKNTNSIRIDFYQIASKNATGIGSVIALKSSSAFLSNTTSPANNTAYTIPV